MWEQTAPNTYIRIITFFNTNIPVIVLCVFPGMVTTSRAMYSLIAILTEHPVIQAKLQQEVDETIGARKPRLKDRPNMPYTEAVSINPRANMPYTEAMSTNPRLKGRPNMPTLKLCVQT